MFTCTHIDHVGINTNDMEATLQFYCDILGTFAEACDNDEVCADSSRSSGRG